MSLGTTTRSLTRNAKKQFPGASDADIRQLVLLQVNVALDHPTNTVKDDEILQLGAIAFEEAVANGETWAVALKNSFRDNVVKPLVAEARAKGVDPVAVIVFKTDLDESGAKQMVESLENASAADEDEIDPFENGASETEDGADADLVGAASH